MSTLAARIRHLRGVLPRAEIARRLNTSTTYVRVVLNHRREGISTYDRAYIDKPGNRERMRARVQAEYHAVPRAERFRIRAEVMATCRSAGMTDRQAYSKAALAVRRRGREILRAAEVQ